jgi:S1-C subfamily serine protease
VFVNPVLGDFRLAVGSAAFAVGFRNFSMDSFGVVSPALRAIARVPSFPVVHAVDRMGSDTQSVFMGAKVKPMSTLGERSATGMEAIRGVLVLKVAQGSALAGVLRVNDVILGLNGKSINTLRDLLEARTLVTGSEIEIVVFRNQRELILRVELKNTLNSTL